MSDETAIRRRLEKRASVMGDRDAQAAVRYYADDVVNFDIAPPLAQRGREATDPPSCKDGSTLGMERLD